MKKQYKILSMRKVRFFYLLPSLLIWTIIPLQGQELKLVPSPTFAIKANVLSYAATSLNLAGEIKLAPRYTLDLGVTYNPWSFKDNKKMKHVLVQPEVRYWFCEAFNRTFMGLHAHYGYYNVGGIGLNDFMKEHRHEGWLAGAGLSVGHQWLLSERWSIEATLGVGYAYMDYEQFPCEKCGEKIKDKTTQYFGPTKLGVSVIYILK